MLAGAVTAAGPSPGTSAQEAATASARPSPVARPTPRTLPTDLEPTLAEARDIRPRAYADGCHARAGETRAHACRYGVDDGRYSVLLIGDSHAVQWLPALEQLAEEEGWRLYSLTKSACPVPRTTVIVRGKRLRDCDRWRKAAFERIEGLHPDLVIAASLGRIYEMPGGDTRRRRDRLWRAAWIDSLAALRARAGAVVLLGDTPMWREDPIDCLRDHPRDIGRCDTPRDEAVSSRTDAIERAAAARADVGYVPSAGLVCPGDPCQAVIGRYLVLVDTQHMTVAWARHIAPGLLDGLACVVPSDALVGTHPSPGPSGWPIPSPSTTAGLSSVPPEATTGPSVVPGASPTTPIGLLNCPS